MVLTISDYSDYSTIVGLMIHTFQLEVTTATITTSNDGAIQKVKITDEYFLIIAYTP